MAKDIQHGIARWVVVALQAPMAMGFLALSDPNLLCARSTQQELRSIESLYVHRLADLTRSGAHSHGWHISAIVTCICAKVLYMQASWRTLARFLLHKSGRTSPGLGRKRARSKAASGPS